MIKFYQDFTHYNSKTLDPDIWVIQTGGHGFGNKELQYYTTNPRNLFIDKDGLHIKAYKERYDKNDYTSARIFTKESFKYGKISFEIKLPKKQGTWPAIWMLGEEIRETHSWPACGEIDLMEAIGRMPGVVHVSLHSKNYNHIIGNHPTKIIAYDESLEYHKMQISWNAEGFSLDLDGKHYDLFKSPKNKCHDDWPFDDKYFLIINMAIGGFFPGNPNDDFDEDEFIIRYIKIEGEDND